MNERWKLVCVIALASFLSAIIGSSVILYASVATLRSEGRRQRTLRRQVWREEYRRQFERR